MKDSHAHSLTIPRILLWADAHHRRTGQWPVVRSGRIRGSFGQTWSSVNLALDRGFRGLPGGDSLARLLARHRRSAASRQRSQLTVKEILAWADDHRRRTGEWPAIRSGPIHKARGENWRRIDGALRAGSRGLRPGSSLAKLLNRHRNREADLLLRVHDILAWADAHRRRTGDWPVILSGPIWDAPGKTWRGINNALLVGTRGLPGGDSLARCLKRYRGKAIRKGLPRYSRTQILAWADAYIRRTGRRPTVKSGPIPESPGDTWSSVDRALTSGRRGFPGGSSLARFLDQQGRTNGWARRKKRSKRSGRA